MAACTNAEDLFLINSIDYCKQSYDLPGAKSNEQQAIIKIQNVHYNNSCIRTCICGNTVPWLFRIVGTEDNV